VSSQSTFLYMFTTQQMCELHWDDLLDIYFAALAMLGQSVSSVKIDIEMARCPELPSTRPKKVRFSCRSCYAMETIDWSRWRKVTYFSISFPWFMQIWDGTCTRNRLRMRTRCILRSLRSWDNLSVFVFVFLKMYSI